MREKWPRSMDGWRRALGQCRYALLVLAVGALLLVLPVGGRQEGAKETPQASQEGFDLAGFEEDLEQALSQIRGAGQVEVVLAVEGSGRRVLAMDAQRDSGGGRSTVVTLGRGSGGQEVVPLQTLAPQFRGALVVCAGGADPQVRLGVISAVSALTGLGSDKIQVCEGGT